VNEELNTAEKVISALAGIGACTVLYSAALVVADMMAAPAEFYHCSRVVLYGVVSVNLLLLLQRFLPKGMQ
jgi:hypothetical protein